MSNWPCHNVATLVPPEIAIINEKNEVNTALEEPML
jgi:hypothetical protein